MNHPLPSFRATPECVLCPLHQGARPPGIPPRWAPWSRAPNIGLPAIVCIGINPGIIEQYANKPWIGPSGEELCRWFTESTRLYMFATVYLANVARCGPDSDISLTDARTCINSYLLADLSTIAASHPKGLAIFALGKIPATSLFPVLFPSHKRAMSLQAAYTLNGLLTTWTISGHEVPLTWFATYHPARLLRSDSADDQRIIASRIAGHLASLYQWCLGEDPTPSPPIPPNPQPLPSVPLEEIC